MQQARAVTNTSIQIHNQAHIAMPTVLGYTDHGGLESGWCTFGKPSSCPYQRGWRQHPKQSQVVSEQTVPLMDTWDGA